MHIGWAARFKPYFFNRAIDCGCCSCSFSLPSSPLLIVLLLTHDAIAADSSALGGDASFAGKEKMPDGGLFCCRFRSSERRRTSVVYHRLLLCNMTRSPQNVCTKCNACKVIFIDTANSAAEVFGRTPAPTGIYCEAGKGQAVFTKVFFTTATPPLQLIVTEKCRCFRCALHHR